MSVLTDWELAHDVSGFAIRRRQPRIRIGDPPAARNSQLSTLPAGRAVFSAAVYYS